MSAGTLQKAIDSAEQLAKLSYNSCPSTPHPGAPTKRPFISVEAEVPDSCNCEKGSNAEEGAGHVQVRTALAAAFEEAENRDSDEVRDTDMSMHQDNGFLHAQRAAGIAMCPASACPVGPLSA